jgi:tRNA pseudouridine38-40 synthase
VPVIKAVIEYDGTDFCGFQKQLSVRTVQGELERAGCRLFQERNFKLVGAGRTDAGVHATGQVVSFSAPDAFPIDRLCPAMNGVLPADVRVKTAKMVSDDFHARYSAKSRTYVYVVLDRESPSALLRRYTWQVSHSIDLGDMRSAADELVGIKDFASLGEPAKSGGTTERQIFSLQIGKKKDAVFFKIKANAFLRGMARAIVGMLVEVGRGRHSPDEVREILAARDRRLIRVIAPPQGLFLTRVEY